MSFETIPSITGQSCPHLIAFENVYKIFAFPQSVQKLIVLDGGNVWTHTLQNPSENLKQDDNSIAKDTTFRVVSTLISISEHVFFINYTPVLAVRKGRPCFLIGVAESVLNTVWLKS